MKDEEAVAVVEERVVQRFDIERGAASDWVQRMDG
jgi:hypothetical protein